MYSYQITETQSAGVEEACKSGGLKYLAPNINVYVLMIFTAFSLESGKGVMNLFYTIVFTTMW